MIITRIVRFTDRWLKTLAAKMEFQALIRRGIVTVGQYTYGYVKVNYWQEDYRLSIGNFCSIAEGVEIFLGGNHRVDWLSTYPFPSQTSYFPEARNIKGHPATKGNVVIGNDVWIGKGSMIMSGVTIGDGAVIGARSVITSDIEPYSIVAGNPARLIRKRFDTEIIQNLLKIKWWDWPIGKIKKNVHLLCSNDIAQLLASIDVTEDHS
jgi:acetyltransferase-like isoleucine patch superfamily enzyme